MWVIEFIPKRKLLAEPEADHEWTALLDLFAEEPAQNDLDLLELDDPAYAYRKREVA